MCRGRLSLPGCRSIIQPISIGQSIAVVATLARAWTRSGNHGLATAATRANAIVISWPMLSHFHSGHFTVAAVGCPQSRASNHDSLRQWLNPVRLLRNGHGTRSSAPVVTLHCHFEVTPPQGPTVAPEQTQEFVCSPASRRSRYQRNVKDRLKAELPTVVCPFVRQLPIQLQRKLRIDSGLPKPKYGGCDGLTRCRSPRQSLSLLRPGLACVMFAGCVRTSVATRIARK